MEYIVIAVVVAAAGILRLWIVQRRTRSSLDTIEVFRTSLERISTQPIAHPGGSAHGGERRRPGGDAPRRPRPVRRAGSSGARHIAPPAAARAGIGDAQPAAAAVHVSSRRASSLDPARRAAAKQRLEARRRSMQSR